jgi:hypothetical protein
MLGRLGLMRPILRTLMIVSAVAILTAQAFADGEIVIAIRYLQAEGTSHSHLYLYRDIGRVKLRRSSPGVKVTNNRE